MASPAPKMVPKMTSPDSQMVSPAPTPPQTPKALTGIEKRKLNLKRGGTNPGSGRPPLSAKVQREQLLKELGDFVGQSGKSTSEVAKDALQSLIDSKDGPTIRWYYDQVIGSPRTSIEHVISNTEMFEALAEVLPGYVPSIETCKEIVVALHSRLTAR